MNAIKAKKIQIALLIIACVVFVVGLILSSKAEKEKAHDVGAIGIEIVNDHTENEGKTYYVYTDFKIYNGTEATLKYLTVVTYFTDKEGKAIGSMTSSFGSSLSWEDGLALDSKEDVIRTSYLQESYSKWGQLFEELYENGVSSYDVRHEITYAVWSDGYEWRK